jgi:hypothetical protein
VRRAARRLAFTLLLGAAAAVRAAAPAPGNDEAAAYAAAGLSAADGGWRRSGCATLFKPSTERLDVDGDGRSEIALFLGPSPCFAETAGGNVALFVRDADGRWVERLGWPPGVELVPTGASTAGHADLGVANPGGCLAVFRWNGSAYAHALNRAIEPGGCQFR